MINFMIKILFSFFFFLSTGLYAQTSQPSGAVSTATGGTGVGLIEMSESALINPATIPAYSNKQMSLSYSKDRFAVSLTDNGADALFPASLAYEQTSNDIFKNKIYHLILAYSFNGVKEGTFSLGLDFSMHDFKIISTDLNYKQNKVTTGLFWQINSAASLGITYKNKALNDTDLPDTFDQATSINLGLAYVYQKFAQLRADVEKIENQNADRLIYKIGVETYLNEWIITRFGYRNDNMNSMNYATAGLGFVGPQFGLHYAYQVEAKNTVDPLHVVDLSVPF
jgi:hypothetical protein